MNKEFITTWVPRKLWLHKEKRAPLDSSTSSAKIEQKDSYDEFTYQEAL